MPFLKIATLAMAKVMGLHHMAASLRKFSRLRLCQAEDQAAETLRYERFKRVAQNLMICKIMINWCRPWITNKYLPSAWRSTPRCNSCTRDVYQTCYRTKATLWTRKESRAALGITKEVPTTQRRSHGIISDKEKYDLIINIFLNSI